MRRAPAVLAALVVLTAPALAGCADDEEDARTLTVLAAASLSEAFGVLAEDFEQDHPGTRVRLVLESSATLATQVREGAPADVLATADVETMGTVEEAGAVGEPVVFARNELVLVVPAGNPAGIRTTTDLADPGVTFVTCVPTAPCGKVADRLLEDAGQPAAPSSLEVDVKAVLAKVVGDEADAGLVYRTDAKAAGDAVEVLPVEGSAEQLNEYPIAVVEGAASPELAEAWVDLVLSPPGQTVLETAGFRPGGRPVR